MDKERASDQLCGALIRSIHAQIRVLEKSLDGSMEGFGLRGPDLSAAQDLLAELQQLVTHSCFVMRQPAVRDAISREVAYSEAVEHQGVEGDNAFFRFKAAMNGLYCRSRTSKKLRAEVEELYRPGSKPA